MAEEKVTATDAAEKVEVTEEVASEATPTVATDWSTIPEAELSAIVEAKTGIRLEGLPGLKKVNAEIKDERKVLRDEIHELKAFKEQQEVQDASGKSELEGIYNKRLNDLKTKETANVMQAKMAQTQAEERMKEFILEAKCREKVSALIDPDLVTYLVTDISKDFGVGDDNNLYKLEDIDGKRVVGKTSFDDEFDEWFGKHRLSGWKLEDGIKGSGSRTGNSLKDEGPTVDEEMRSLFSVGTTEPKSIY